MDKNQDKNFYGLSVRGYQYAITPSRIDHALFMEAKQNLYNPEDNPSGSFPLNVAETQLMAPILKTKLSNYVKANEMPDWILGYIHYLGHPEVRVLIAQFMVYRLGQRPLWS